MTGILIALAFGWVGLLVYAYVAYPVILKLAGTFRAKSQRRPVSEWPTVTVVVPAYNEERSIAGTLENLLQLDYPAEKRDILVVSDASTDATDAIVSGFSDQGVRLLRMPRRAGKTAAENGARAHLIGDVVVNTDASVRVHREALRPLIAALADPSVGIASGYDVSVSHQTSDVNVGEGSYVNYEMWVRSLETRVYGIVGASGCLYAARRSLHDVDVPEPLSRDFAAPLIAREHGMRSVSVPDAICYVPRSRSHRQEYRRKVRTMTRGLQTLLFKRHLLNPLRFGVFAWMLISHKLCRWLVPCFVLVGFFALALLSLARPWAALGLVLMTALFLLAGLGSLWPEQRRLPRLVALPLYFATGTIAGIHAWLRVLRGERNPTWEPTRRKVIGEVR